MGITVWHLRGGSNRFLHVCGSALIAAAASPASADSNGSCPILGAGGVHISPRSSSGPLVVSEIGGQPVDLPVADSGVQALSANTLLLLVECERDEHLKFRFVFGIPPTHELQGTGSLASAGVIGRAQQWSPTILAIYTFLPSETAVRPFLGLGFNYTFFKRAEITNDAFRTANFGPNATTSVSVDSSWNPVATVGFAIRVDERWSVETAASYAPLKTRVTVAADNTALGVPVKAFSDVKNRSINTSITVNYRYGD